MEYLELGPHESRLANGTKAWDKWIEQAEEFHGGTLDGDQKTDGYSLDGAYNAFTNGLTPFQYVLSWRMNGVASEYLKS